MIYLFSQIAISLALAAIVGGAAGWLAHRARSSKQIGQLESVVSRQHQQVSEASTQVSILTGDFDDLKQHSEAEISALRTDNQKIPALNQNLEKSQLLVRQLMQQHKAEMVELVGENNSLKAKAKLVNDREQAVTKLQAELDIEKRRNQQLSTEAGSANSGVADKTSTDNTTPPVETQAELALADKANSDSAATSSTATAQTDDSPEASANEASAKTKTSDESSDKPAKQTNKRLAATKSTAAETEAELKLLRDQLAEDLPSKKRTKKSKPSSAPAHKLSETTVDENHLEPLFEPVAQHDDLKQIFGIGPVTEKTLNKLGITTYSQLAELKQHDIEKIAEALQIFPGRIERDNWVGGARAQLEEVLENL